MSEVRGVQITGERLQTRGTSKKGYLKKKKPANPINKKKKIQSPQMPKRKDQDKAHATKQELLCFPERKPQKFSLPQKKKRKTK